MQINYIIIIHRILRNYFYPKYLPSQECFNAGSGEVRCGSAPLRDPPLPPVAQRDVYANHVAAREDKQLYAHREREKVQGPLGKECTGENRIVHEGAHVGRNRRQDGEFK